MPLTFLVYYSYLVNHYLEDLIYKNAHLRGYRNFSVNDGSRNLWWAALLAYGEGWHNNHHAHPNVAKAGQRWWEIDVTWWAIQALNTLGLAQKIVKLNPQGSV